MQTIRRTPSIFPLALIVVAGLTLVAFNRVDARPKYKSVFTKKYTAKLDKKLLSCLACHEKKDDGKPNTKMRNIYGKAVQKAVAKKNEKDAKKIEAALDKAAKEKSAIKDKTFGDLINAGKAPASTK